MKQLETSLTATGWMNEPRPPTRSSGRCPLGEKVRMQSNDNDGDTMEEAQIKITIQIKITAPLFPMAPPRYPLGDFFHSIPTPVTELSSVM